MRRLAAVGTLAIGLALGANARADELYDLVRPTPGMTTKQHVERRLQLASEVMATGVNALSLGLVEMRPDVSGKRARLSVGGGDPDLVRLRFDSEVVVVGDRAEVRTRLDFSLKGHRLELGLPDMVVVPEGLDGGAQIQVPILTKTF